jgi:uncharacterized protein
MDRATQNAADGAENISSLIVSIARSLVDIPDRVSVELSTEQNRTVVRLHVDPQDVGKVIGKQGRTARSLRTILSAVSMKLKHHYALDIVEESEESVVESPSNHL